MTHLRWLVLDHNQLQSDDLDQAALQNQSHICYFFANHNNLKSVPNALPAGLRELRLAHNRISSMGGGALRSMSKLRLLLLQGNRLHTMTGEDLKGCCYASLRLMHVAVYVRLCAELLAMCICNTGSRPGNAKVVGMIPND